MGVAPKVKILPVVIDGLSGSLINGLHYAADHGAQVINVSSGYPYPGGCDAIAQMAVNYALSKGAVVVASMGNEGNTTNDMEEPASCAGVLGVGAVNNHKLAWTDTERQPYVSAAAPGVEVGSVNKYGAFNNSISGTSQAAALTSAAVAIVRAKFPELSPREVVQRMINTTVDAGPPGPDDMTGSGVIVPIRALTMDVPKTAPNPTFDRLDQWCAEYPTLTKDSPCPQPSASPTTPPAAVAQQAPTQKSSYSGFYSALLILGAMFVLAIVVVALVVVFSRRRRITTQPGSFGTWQPQQMFPPGSPEYPPAPPPPGYWNRPY